MLVAVTSMFVAETRDTIFGAKIGWGAETERFSSNGEDVRSGLKRRRLVGCFDIEDDGIGSKMVSCGLLVSDTFDECAERVVARSQDFQTTHALMANENPVFLTKEVKPPMYSRLGLFHFMHSCLGACKAKQGGWTKREEV